RIHYEDLYRDDDVYSYIPAIRRIRRLTGSDVTDPVLGSDGCYDDFEGWHQKLNPKMTFKILGKREFLVPRHSLKKQLPKESEYIKKDFFQIEWEVRPLFILEVQLNDPDYAYSKRIYFTEDDGTAGIAYGEAYDQKGRFWRCNYIYIHRYIEPETLHRNYYGCMFKDVISGHSSAMPTDPVDLNLSKVFIPEEYFTVRGLLRKAR
ncbi:MAG: DUF1329 domain-containing protein, partial [Thermodesulfobacteriota bacterium]|nr:DUF1329 domain-containing protein [Thermodesulfobacteriota bacterium]